MNDFIAGFPLHQEAITGNRFATFSNPILTIATPTLNPQKQQMLNEQNCIIFCKSDYLATLFTALSNNHKHHVLISHNSDFVITQQVFAARPPCIAKWFARNVTFAHDDLVPIPIGLENAGEGLSGDIDFITYVNSHVFKPDDTMIKVYLNCNANTQKGVRTDAIEYFTKQPFTTVDTTRKTFAQYTQLVREHHFIVSPPGNGPDCHRTWEALCCGTIPIVFGDVFTYAFSDLPLLIVNSWDEVTEPMLRGFYQKVQSGSYSLQKLKMSYWRSQIEKALAEIV